MPAPADGERLAPPIPASLASTRPPGVLLVLLAAATTLSVLQSCRKAVVVGRIDREGCAQEVAAAFGDQGASVVAVRPADGGTVFRPEILGAVDDVCRAFEDRMTDDALAVRCLTSLPIMEGRPAGTRVLVARDDLPETAEEALLLQQLVLQLEFARGDVIDDAGGLVTFVHLPDSSFQGVDLAAVLEEQAARHEALLDLALDRGEAGERDQYRRVAGDGPSARHLVGIFDSGEKGGMKEPASLQALERFQAAAEASPKVAQTFTIADDLKLVRRGLHKGNPADAVIPLRRSEVSQLLLALSMAPGAGAFGVRLDNAERIGLVRVNLSAVPRDVEARLARRLDEALSREAPAGGRAFLCLDRAGPEEAEAP